MSRVPKGDGLVAICTALGDVTMLQEARGLALVCVVALVAGGAAPVPREAPNPDLARGFEDILDASRLPRIAGAQELFASKSTTSFLVRESIAQATDATRTLLAAEGWQPHGAPVVSNGSRDIFAIMNLRKGSQGLNVFITVVPERGGATWVQYTPIAIANNSQLSENAKGREDGKIGVELIAGPHGALASQAGPFAPVMMCHGPCDN